MPRVALLGDSIFDNAAYTAGGPAVIDHLGSVLPEDWRADLLAVDGAVAADVPAQLRRLGASTTHLVLSVGGNDALHRADVLDARVQSSGQALLLLAEAAADFEARYRQSISRCLEPGLPLLICTIYNGNFPDRNYRYAVRTALLAFNDVILRVATEHDLRVLDLRLVCCTPDDYANPIEPSVQGGAKIAQAITRALVEGRFRGRGAHVSA